MTNEEFVRTLSINTLLVMLAWEAGEITTTLAARLLSTDIVSARERLQRAISIGVKVSEGKACVVTPEVSGCSND